MRYPGALWIPSPNFNAGGLRSPVLGAVQHTMDGTIVACDAVFLNPAPGGDRRNAVSAHFGISLAGEIHQYVEITDRAWHAGPANDHYIGIEFEDGWHGPGPITTPMSSTQISAGAALIAWLSQRLGFPIEAATALGQPGIIGHREAWPDGGHTCPDPTRLAQKPTLIAAALAIVNPAPPSEEEFNMVAYDPVSGGSWTVDSDGSVYAAFGAPYRGGASDNHWNLAGPVVGIQYWRNPANGHDGYMIVTRAGTPVGPGVDGVSPGDIHRYYKAVR